MYKRKLILLCKYTKIAFGYCIFFSFVVSYNSCQRRYHFSDSALGYSQAVRQRTLTPSFRWFESTYPNQYFGVSPSGKALDSDSSIPGFESLLPNHLTVRLVCCTVLFLHNINRTGFSNPVRCFSYLRSSCAAIFFK